MRKVTFGVNLSIDACYDHTRFNGDEEIHQYFADISQDVDLVVYGRKMYQLIVPYWTEVAKNKTGVEGTDKFAKGVNDVEKIVFSRTLESVEGNTRILRGNLEEEIRKLKQQPGKNISIAGMTLRSQLTALGLIDEFHFVIHPGIVGQGKRFMEDEGLTETLNLKLVAAKVFKSGCVALHYVKQ
ncbi:dihydrofolate reductase family protein [Mucilaginibacter sp. HMF5004]|uniref:dihydrofolate reductase family protein n=1 Tax=Mucilaginibacter rivuli TaxID=2857527 RepID=UPI001C5D3A65|nr:dihydrofolate reductase family protein [Mucilaginibacter rivuli]MBW4888449.1 dihydrofolate reductase family protein [Mucilaginibacter rivuli]